MKTENFTIENYRHAISREQAKRATTYPKMLEKKRKQGLSNEEIASLSGDLSAYDFSLRLALKCIDNRVDIDKIQFSDRQVSLNELIRELKMRRSYYPRLIYFKRLDQATADYELAVWESLTRWFAKEFLGLDELPTTRSNKK